MHGQVVTLGQTGVQLDRPMRLIWRPGVDGAGRKVSEPARYDAEALARVGDRVLGPGCVVTYHLDPDYQEPPGPANRPALLLVDATDPGDPNAWLVNEPLTYRACTTCGSRVPDLPEHHVPTAWTPRQTQVLRGGRGRALVPVDQGPHPAGSLACSDCDPQTTGSTG